MKADGLVRYNTDAVTEASPRLAGHVSIDHPVGSRRSRASTPAP